MSATTTALAAPSNGEDLFWSREGPEEPQPIDSCAREDCAGAVETPFDVYCNAPTQHLALLGSGSWAQRVAVYGARAIIGALTVAAAALASPAPLYGAVLLLGLLLIVPLLRAFPRSRAIAAGGWVFAVSFVAALREGLVATGVGELALAIVVAVVLVALPVAVYLRCGPNGQAQRATATGLAAAGVLVLFVAFLEFGMVAIGVDAEPWLLLAALATVGGAVGAAALAGVFEASTTVSYAPPFVPPAPFEPPRIGMAQRPRARAHATTPTAQLAAGVREAVARLANQTTALCNNLLKILWRAAHQLARLAKLGLHTARVWLVRLGLLIAASAKAAGRTMSAAGTTIVTTGRQWGRSSLAPATLILGGGFMAVIAADEFSSYLNHGTVTRSVSTIALACMAATALVVLAWALTGWPASIVRSAASRTAANGGPSVLLTLVTLGWLLGIPGFFGLSPITPGLLTALGTAAFLGSLAYEFLAGQQVGEVVAEEAS